MCVRIKHMTRGCLVSARPWLLLILFFEVNLSRNNFSSGDCSQAAHYKTWLWSEANTLWMWDLASFTFLRWSEVFIFLQPHVFLFFCRFLVSAHRNPLLPLFSIMQAGKHDCVAVTTVMLWLAGEWAVDWWPVPGFFPPYVPGAGT